MNTTELVVESQSRQGLFSVAYENQGYRSKGYCSPSGWDTIPPQLILWVSSDFPDNGERMKKDGCDERVHVGTVLL